MKHLLKSKTLLSTTFLLLSYNALASNKVIYGSDDRKDVIESTNSMFVELSESTAGMIPHSLIKELDAKQVTIGGKTLEQRGMCSTERFAKQPTAANCSGFLVAKNLLVTAGHCIRSQSDCDSNAWVFDYKVDYEEQSEVIVDKTSVLKCKKIVSRSLDSATQNDFALLELEREVTDRKPLKFRREGKAEIGDQLVVIGHPTGLPTKIADGAAVRSINDVFLVANLDTYGGNSGSAVFNATTGVIEGILVRGETDYNYDYNLGCRVSNVEDNAGGRGEDVTLITNIAELASISDPADDDVISDPSDDDVVTDPVGDDLSDQAPMSFIEWLRRFLGL